MQTKNVTIDSIEISRDRVIHISLGKRLLSGDRVFYRSTLRVYITPSMDLDKFIQTTNSCLFFSGWLSLSPSDVARISRIVDAEHTSFEEYKDNPVYSITPADFPSEYPHAGPENPNYRDAHAGPSHYDPYPRRRS